MSLDHKEYLSLLREETDTMEKLIGLARRKTEAVRKDDLAELNECMKQEQALSLALRGFEQKRLNALPALGLSGTTLSALSDQYPPELRLEAKQVAEELLRQYHIYRSAAEVARSALECNLHEIEGILTEAGVEHVPGTGYTAPEAAVPPAPMRSDFRA